jgi:tetratricopeptide (TPR) repeat protein
MQKSENHTVSVDAVSARLLYHRKCGKVFYLKGDGIIRKSGKEMEFLKYEEAANFFYKSSLSYKSCSRWREAGDSLLRGAWCYERLKAYLIAAATYCEAAETFLKTDKTEAIEAYKTASKLYSNNKKRDIAGTLERKVALLHYSDKNWEEAATHFSKAGMLLEGEAYRNQSDSCFQKTAECYVLNGIELDEASRIYEAIAESCVRSNLRRFNARDYLLKAIFCLFGEPLPDIEADDDDDDDDDEAVFKEVNENSETKYNSIEWKVHEYEVTDYLWKCSKEALFLKVLTCAYLFVHHMNHYLYR